MILLNFEKIKIKNGLLTRTIMHINIMKFETEYFILKVLHYNLIAG